MDSQHISFKLFLKDAPDFEMASMIPIFHAWIQRGELDDLMLIDVADYSHIHQGPGVMLICHEGQIAIDRDQGRLGLLYSNKHGANGSVQDRLREALRRTLSAAKRLEAEPRLTGQIAFIANELLIRIDDRLMAPNTAQTFGALKPDLEQFLSGLYNGNRVDLQHVENPKTGFTVKATTSTSPDVATLLGRVAGA